MDQHPGGDRADVGRSPSGGDTARRPGPLSAPGRPATTTAGSVPPATPAAPVEAANTVGPADPPDPDPPVASRPVVLGAAVGALMAAATTGVLWWGAGQSELRYAVVVLAVQVVLVATWCWVSRPPTVATVAGIGVLAAVGADAAGLWYRPPSADPLVAVVLGAFLAAVVVQLGRGAARRHVTEALGATLAVVVAVVALGTTVPLHRNDGTALLTGFLLASGAGIAVARLSDLVVPRPPVHEAVPRGTAGVVFGGLAGGLAATVSAALTGPLSVWLAAIAGWFVATTAVLADLAVDHAGVASPPGRPRVAPALLGPLFGLAITAPAGYVFGLVFLS